MPQYTHLHNHTSASFFDGTQRPKDFARRIDELSMDGAAITDHGVCYAWPDFQEACDDVGVDPVLGVEAYLVEDRDEITQLREKGGAARTEREENILKTSYHQVLLAKDREGLENLMSLMSWAAGEGFYYDPLIDFKKLKEYSEGLIGTSSCIQGLIPQIALGNGRFEELSKAERMRKIYEVTEAYLDIFGEDFYLEVHDHGIDDEQVMRDVAEHLQDEYDLSVISANDCHYSRPDDYWAQKVRTCLATSNPGDPTYFDDPKVEKYAHENLHVKGAQEMIDLMGERFPDAAQNTMEVLSKCDARLPMEDGEYFFPEFPELGPAETAHERLKRECAKGFRRKYPNATEAHKERIRYELGVIDDMGFNNYFLIVSDMTRYAKNQGIQVGPGRGSAAGSMVTYCLDITGLDPMKHDLLFDRFLNKSRVTMPDIDIDFDDERREEVLNYLRRKYGHESVAQVITFNNYKTSNAIRDAGKSFRLEQPEINDIADRIPDEPWVRSATIDEVKEEIPELGDLEESDDRIEKTFEAARQLYGMESHTGKHPAAAVVTPGKINDYVPTEKDTNSDGDEITLTQFDGDHLEELGLLKIDVLGLKTLRTIRVANDIVEERTGNKVPQDTLNARDDEEVYEKVFATGDTLGIFQLSGDGMRTALEDMGPWKFTHIAAMNALYRPGPMQYIPAFNARMNGEEEVIYIDESIHDKIKGEVDDILDDTYGIMVFQEQVMQVCQRLAGFTLGDADIMRRAIGKKKTKLLMKQKEKFVEGCEEEGYSKSLGETIFDKIEEFADYAFNRAHASCYAAVAYQQAYFKAHHPVAFFAAALRTEDKEEEQVDIIQDAKSHGVEVLPPSVNESGQGFTPIPGKRQIRFGLGTIKGVGKQAQKIIDEREENGEYESFLNFLMRAIPNLRAVKPLVKAGAMDGFDLSRKAMFMQADDILTYVRKMRDYRTGDRVSEPDEPEIKGKPEWSKKMRFQQERDVAGIYTTGEPTDRFPKLVDTFHGNSHIKKSQRYGDSNFMVRCGSILSTWRTTTSNDNPMWKVRYLTPDGIKTNPIWERRYKQIKDNLETDVPLLFVGEADVEGQWAGSPAIMNVMPMRRLPSRWVQVLRVTVDSESEKKTALQYFQGLPEGETEIWITVPAGTTCCMEKSVQLDLETYQESQTFGEVSIY